MVRLSKTYTRHRLNGETSDGTTTVYGAPARFSPVNRRNRGMVRVTFGMETELTTMVNMVPWLGKWNPVSVQLFTTVRRAVLLVLMIMQSRAPIS